MKAKMNVLYTEAVQYCEKAVTNHRGYERWPYASCRLVVFTSPNDPSDRTAVFDLAAGDVIAFQGEVPQETQRHFWDARGVSDAALIRRAIDEFDAWRTTVDLDALAAWPKIGEDNE